MTVEFRRPKHQEFEQRVYVDQYHIVSARLRKLHPGMWVKDDNGSEEKVIVVGDGRDDLWRFRASYRAYSPMDFSSNNQLVREFANVDYEDENSILAFVNEYGLLEECYVGCAVEWRRLSLHDSESGKHSYRWFEPIQDIKYAIIYIRECIEMLDAIRSHDPDKIVAVLDPQIWLYDEDKFTIRCEHAKIYGHDDDALVKSPWLDKMMKKFTVLTPPIDELIVMCREELSNRLNQELATAVTGVLQERGIGEYTLKLLPRNLLAAIYLLLSQDFAGERSWQKCEECDNWWEVGPGDKAHTIRKRFCSDACRLRANRRSKKQSDQHNQTKALH